MYTTFTSSIAHITNNLAFLTEEESSKTSKFTTPSSNFHSNRTFHKTPTGFTNTLPSKKKKSNQMVKSSTVKKRQKNSPSIKHSRELTPKEKEILSGGVSGLDLLLNDSFW